MCLKLEHVSYVYGANTAFEHQALADVSLEIKKGQFIGVIGHTGSGKSTLMQMCNGLEKPTSGAVYFHGRNIHDPSFDKKALRCSVGMVFQYPEHQLFAETILEDAAYGPVNQGLSKEEALTKAGKALLMTGLDEKWHGYSPFELSGGQKRRAAIAGVLAMEPEILILDEPTAGLDPRGRDEILDLIAKLHRETAMTVLLVSHSMEDVARYADRILVMEDGRLRFDDVPFQVFSHHEELQAMGLDAPALTDVLHGLKDLGWPVETYAQTARDACGMILQALDTMKQEG